jgi:hypothetical protein
VHSLFALQSKYKIALVLFVMIVTLLCGILLERHFFQRVDSTSTALYEDRLLPSAFVYHLTDFIHQRHRTAETIHLVQRAVPTEQQLAELAQYRHQTDSILVAFQHTFLVQDESASLDRLGHELAAYATVERQLLSAPASAESFARLESHLDAIRAELLQLSAIQTTVGKELVADTESVVARAHFLSNFEVGIVIVCCLIAQVLVLSSKVVRSPIVQRPNLN